MHRLLLGVLFPPGRSLIRKVLAGAAALAGFGAICWTIVAASAGDDEAAADVAGGVTAIGVTILLGTALADMIMRRIRRRR